MVSAGRQYEVLHVLGHGGFGTVYRARYVGEGGFSKDVALKVLNAHLDGVDEVAERLRDEARLLGLIRHRAIVQVDRLTQLDGRWTVVMEYVEGVSLGRLLRAGPLPTGPALEIVGEIAGALHVAYTRAGAGGQPLRLLHRDIKPQNIQITPAGEVKVLDFGIARADFESREARTRSVYYGTPEYMAPERLDLHQDGPEADVYSLGVVLLEALTARKFGRTSALRERHEPRVEAALERLIERHRPPDDVVQLLNDMLAWSPEARPSAGDVERRAVRLRVQLSDEPARIWAERVVAPLAADRQPLDSDEAETARDEHREDLSGSILEERQDRAPRAPPPPPVLPPVLPPVVPRPTAPPAVAPRPVEARPTPAPPSALAPPPEPAAPRLPVVLGGVVLAGLVVASLGAAGLALLFSRPATPPPAAAQIDRASINESEKIQTEIISPAAVTPEPSGAPAAPPPAEVGTSAVASSPQAGGSTSAGSAAAGLARVTVTGDADKVVFVASDGAVYNSSQRLPAGAYQVRASFGGGEPVGAGTVDVPSGGRLSLECSSMFRLCKVLR